MELFKLFGSVLIDTAKAEESLSKTEKKADGFGTKLGAGIKTAAKWGAGLATAAGVAGTAMLGVATKASDTAREIDRLSQQTGMTTDAYQEWDYIMKQAGYSMEQAAGDLSALGEKAMDAAAGAGEGAELFGKLGVQVTDTSGKLKSQEQIFNETIVALQGMENTTERNAIASALLSTTGEELTSVLNMTGEEVDAMKQKAHELGIVMSGESVDAGVEFGKQLDDVKASFGGVIAEIGIQFMPLLQKFLDWINDHMPEIKKVIEVTFNAVEAVVTVASEAFNVILPILTGLYDWISPYFPTIQNIFETTFKGIGETVESVTEIFWGIVDAVKAAIEWIKSFNKEDKRGEDFDFSQNVSKGDGNKGSRNRVSGSHASGLAYVPYDGYVAEVHKGEEIVKAQDKQSILDILKTLTLNNNQSSQKVELVVNLDGRTLARGLYDPMQNESKLRGTNMAAGVV